MTIKRTVTEHKGRPLDVIQRAENLEPLGTIFNDCSTNSYNDLIIKDLRRTSFLVTDDNSLDIFTEFWEKAYEQSGYSYTQGDMDATSYTELFFLGEKKRQLKAQGIDLDNLKETTSDTETELIQEVLGKQTHTISFAYCSKNYCPCGFSISYFDGEPGRWVAAIIKKASSPLNEREVMFYDAYNSNLNRDQVSVNQMMDNLSGDNDLRAVVSYFFQEDGSINKDSLSAIHSLRQSNICKREGSRENSAIVLRPLDLLERFTRDEDLEFELKGYCLGSIVPSKLSFKDITYEQFVWYSKKLIDDLEKKIKDSSTKYEDKIAYCILCDHLKIEIIQIGRNTRVLKDSLDKEPFMLMIKRQPNNLLYETELLSRPSDESSRLDLKSPYKPSKRLQGVIKNSTVATQLSLDRVENRFKGINPDAVTFLQKLIDIIKRIISKQQSKDVTAMYQFGIFALQFHKQQAFCDQSADASHGG